MEALGGKNAGLVGAMLRSRRRELAETLETVSRRIGVGPGRLSEYERGRRRPHPATFRRLARGYGLPVTAFLLLEAGLAVEKQMRRLEGCIVRERRKLFEILDLEVRERPR